MDRFKGLAIAFSLIILLVITPAVADELPLYFSMNGGFATTFDTHFEAGPSTGHLNYGPGWIGAVAVGARVSRNVRAEIEISNQVVFLDDEVINGFATIDLSGTVQALAGMAKVDYDFDLGSVRPFIGGGMGLVNFGVDLHSPIHLSEQKSVLAGLIEGGISIPLTSNLDAMGRVQVMMLDDVTLAAGGSSATLSHPTFASALFGFRVHF